MVHVARNGTQIDATLRGVPVASPMSIEAFLRSCAAPHRGEFSLPALTLDEAAIAGNMELFFRYLKTHGTAVAPHAKTPMSPEIVAELRRRRHRDAAEHGIDAASNRPPAIEAGHDFGADSGGP